MKQELIDSLVKAGEKLAADDEALSDMRDIVDKLIELYLGTEMGKMPREFLRHPPISIKGLKLEAEQHYMSRFNSGVYNALKVDFYIGIPQELMPIYKVVMDRGKKMAESTFGTIFKEEVRQRLQREKSWTEKEKVRNADKESAKER